MGVLLENFPKFETSKQVYEYMHDADAVAIPVVQFFHKNQLVGQNIKTQFKA